MASETTTSPKARLLRALTTTARARPLRLAALAAILLATALAQAAVKNVVEGVEVEGSGASRAVRIKTSTEPTFTVFRLTNPMRVVVDISGGDISKVEGPIIIEDGIVDQIAMRQFSADGFMIARLIVGFAEDLTYDVRAEGQAVVIRTGPAPDSNVARAIPPPIAPADRAATERMDRARRQAEEAATRAIRERQRARHASAQQEEATRIASEAERLRREAERAKAEAESLREQAKRAIARDRAEAEDAARQAEHRLRRIKDEQNDLAAERAEAERLAVESERARRNAEEVAATA
ncbi:AMIN domain-containing protein, partial [Myxococcota bacterium]